MKQQANTKQEKAPINPINVLAEAKVLRSRELARLSGNVMQMPQALLRRLANKPAAAINDSTASTHTA